MANLQNGLRAPLLNGFGEIAQPGDQLVIIDPQLPLVGFALLRVDIGILDDHQAHSSLGSRGVIVDKLWGNDAVGIAEAGEHRSHDDSIAELQFPQRKWLHQ